MAAHEDGTDAVRHLGEDLGVGVVHVPHPLVQAFTADAEGLARVSSGAVMKPSRDMDIPEITLLVMSGRPSAPTELIGRRGPDRHPRRRCGTPRVDAPRLLDRQPKTFTAW
ncbi:hypothetical protein N7U49_40760 [Streptomyces sp. AD2-2]|nr:hypothetical protein N7U49_40760 [Streptomyces sp. AD2-2]